MVGFFNHFYLPDEKTYVLDVSDAVENFPLDCGKTFILLHVVAIEVGDIPDERIVDCELVNPVCVFNCKDFIVEIVLVEPVYDILKVKLVDIFLAALLALVCDITLEIVCLIDFHQKTNAVELCKLVDVKTIFKSQSVYKLTLGIIDDVLSAFVFD